MALGLTGMLAIGPASATGLNSGTKALDSVIGVNSSSLSYNIRDGVATIFGNTDTRAEVELVESHIRQITGVDRVINLVTYN